MKVEAFIPTWPGPKQHAKELAAVIEKYCPVTILDDPNDYFNAQWEKACAKFTGDIFFWVMADVELPENFDAMYQEMIRVLSQNSVGWYAPDVAWTSYIYDKKDLRCFGGDIYEVPNTDSLCVAVKGDVIRQMPHIDPNVSFMWGADLAATVTARMMGLKVVRDYYFKAKHPNHTGYEVERAGREMIPLFESFTPEMQKEIKVLEDEVRRLRKPFWKDKRVVVTGGSGFLGKHVIEYLKKYRQCENIFVPNFEVYDLRVRADADRVYGVFRPDIVIHLAASVGGLQANINSPGQFFYDNLMMGMNMMGAGRLFGVEKFVQMGSACEYPKNVSIPALESDIWSGYPEETNAPYGIAKRSLLAQGQAYHQQYGMNVIHLLSTNLYGPGDNFDLETSHVIPALIYRCLRAKEENSPYLSVWGSGNATRDFLFVRDAAEGIVLAAEYYNNPAPVNLSSGREVVIWELANKIKQIIGFGGDIIWNTSKPDGQLRRLLDASRAKTFGFTAQTSLDDGLKETIEWYRNSR